MESNYRPVDSLPQPVTCLRNHWLKRKVRFTASTNDKM